MTNPNGAVLRWALWSECWGKFYKPLPHETEVLYDSRRSAIAARLSGSLYQYQPVRVELRPLAAVSSKTDALGHL